MQTVHNPNHPNHPNQVGVAGVPYIILEKQDGSEKCIESTLTLREVLENHTILDIEAVVDPRYATKVASIIIRQTGVIEEETRF